MSRGWLVRHSAIHGPDRHVCKPPMVMFKRIGRTWVCGEPTCRQVFVLRLLCSWTDCIKDWEKAWFSLCWIASILCLAAGSWPSFVFFQVVALLALWEYVGVQNDIDEWTEDGC